MTRELGRADYQERKERRVERLQERAQKAARAGHEKLDAAHQISERFWGGQPILVGHHSEGKARRDQEKIHRTTRAGLDLVDKADHLKARAKAAEANTAISSDDPEALAKLRQKLEQGEAQRTEMKRLNALHKKGGWAAVAADQGDVEAAKMRKRAGHTGDDRPYPAYHLTNLGGNIRRIQKRIAELEATQSTAAPEPETYGDIEVREGDNRVMMFFPGKPSDEVRNQLKINGFRWARSVGAWQRQASVRAWHMARQIAEGAQ